ncbi:MAG: hypothetical protein GC189_08190 [Alphaproteobacteria bacterium]|nr:hypothetical protein [Alphaproteobacteria bacterium]
MKRPALIALIGGGVFVAALLAVVFFVTGGGASATRAPNLASAPAAEPAQVSADEANAWAEARAADSESAYKVYLAAYPEGAFAADARAAIEGGEPVETAAAPAAAPAPVRVAAQAPAPAPIAAPRRPSREEIAASCRAYVDQSLSQPSRVARIGGGAVAGCAVGALAGGDDGRNCAIGAVAGGVTGEVTARSRERRRAQELDACIANGGPPGY